jgi:hypothetical protein
MTKCGLGFCDHGDKFSGFLRGNLWTSKATNHSHFNKNHELQLTSACGEELNARITAASWILTSIIYSREAVLHACTI